MTTRRQLLVSIGLVMVAIAAVAVYSVGSEPAAGVDAMAGMDHSTMAAPTAGDALRPVALDPESARRIGVTYATVSRRPFRRTVTTIGNVTYDETRLVDVNPRVDGWAERLHVDFTGAPVTRGQPLLDVYSPMLVAAQEELLLALQLSQGTKGRAADNASELLESARRRLRYWDIPESEIARIEREGVPQRTLTLMAPASGVVVEKNVVEGGRIMPGMDLYRIADLSRIWIEGEIFEKDLSLVRLRQRALVAFDAYPGERFEGSVAYVYPTVSIDTRTGRVRVELANPGTRFKPGMYARMELDSDDAREALMIPRSAVHYTGARALVFVRAPDGMLVHREITTGLAAGEDIEVLAGLAEGEVVVSSANFLIDAESNMGTSMPGMSMDSGASHDAHSAAPPAGRGGRGDTTGR